MGCRVEDENFIFLTRGDSCLLKIDINDEESGGEYTPDPGDRVRFALKRDKLKPDQSDYVDGEPILVKDIPTDTLLLQLDPEDTKELPFGDYAYDVEITYADGYVDTFIEAARLKLTREVH